MEQEILILSVGNPYHIPGENGRPDVEGCTMFYIPTSDLQQNYDVDTNTLGYVPVKEAMPVSFHERAKEQGVPCKAKAHFVMRISNQKQTLKLDGVDFIASNLSLNEVKSK